MHSVFKFRSQTNVNKSLEQACLMTHAYSAYTVQVLAETPYRHSVKGWPQAGSNGKEKAMKVVLVLVLKLCLYDATV